MRLTQDRLTATRLTQERLGDARRNAGIPRELAAVEAGLSYSAIASYEQGRINPPVAVLKRLARIYGVAVIDLIGDE